MKLRNKKTGEVIEVNSINFGLDDGYAPFSSLRIVNEFWEDYEPAESLIKDEKVRKAVRAWADYHNITKVNCDIGDWDHAGMCLFDSVLQLHSIKDRIVIQFFMDADKRENIKEGTYTIAELCGEEEG